MHRLISTLKIFNDDGFLQPHKILKIKKNYLTTPSYQLILLPAALSLVLLMEQCSPSFLDCKYKLLRRINLGSSKVSSFGVYPKTRHLNEQCMPPEAGQIK